MLGKPIVHPSAWYGDDMRQRQHEWVYTLSQQDVAELEAATAAAAATGKAVEVGGCGQSVSELVWLAGCCPVKVPQDGCISSARAVITQAARRQSPEGDALSPVRAKCVLNHPPGCCCRSALMPLPLLMPCFSLSGHHH